MLDIIGRYLWTADLSKSYTISPNVDTEFVSPRPFSVSLASQKQWKADAAFFAREEASGNCATDSGSRKVVTGPSVMEPTEQLFSKYTF